MTLTCDINHIWYAIRRTSNGVYMGYSPDIKEAIKFCWQLAEEKL